MNSKMKKLKADLKALIDEENAVIEKQELVMENKEGLDTEAYEQAFEDVSDERDETRKKIGRQERLIKQDERRVKMEENSIPIGTVDDFADDVDIDQSVPTMPKWKAGMDGFAFSVIQASTPNGRPTEDFIGYGSAMEIYAAATGMNVQIGSEGGFLLPAELSNIIWDGLNAEEENLLSLTDNFTVTGDSLTFNANAETSRANGSRFGGVESFWKSEAAQFEGSFPKFREVKLQPKKLTVLMYATDELLSQAGPALGQWMTRAAISDIGFKTNDAIINGDGSGKPLGILSSTALVEITKETNQVADTIVAENISKMWSRGHLRSRPVATWYINQDIESQLDLLQVAVGTGGSVVYLPAGGYAAAPFGSLKGRPVKPIEFCPTLGDKGDILLADLKAYVTGTRGTVDSAMSIHLRFNFNETAFRFVFFVDGQPWNVSPITPFKGTATTSPFVVLKARA